MSRAQVHEALDRIVAIHERAGSRMPDLLLPPLTEEEVADRWHGRTPHPSVLDLYTWRGGIDVATWLEDDEDRCFLIEFDFVPPEWLVAIEDIYLDLRDDFDEHQRDDVWAISWTALFILDGASDTLAIDRDDSVRRIIDETAPAKVATSLLDLLRQAEERLAAGADRLFPPDWSLGER